VFALFIIVYKFWNKTSWVKLEDMDIWTGRREFVEEETLKPKTWWSRISDVVGG
jgi:amino acid transporter